MGATVLLLSASLVNLAPPVEVAAAAAVPPASPGPSLAPLTAEGNDFGTSVKVRLEVSPGTAGFDTFTATVTDYDSGAPVAADGVALRFVLPARPTSAARGSTSPRRARGVHGDRQELVARWDVADHRPRGPRHVLGRGPARADDATRGAVASPTPSIDVNAVPGLPTIYTVHLSAGRTVQVYLDPGTPARTRCTPPSSTRRATSCRWPA